MTQADVLKFPLDLKAIKELIPHRYPFLLLDRVHSCDAVYISASKNVSGGDFFLQGHFPSQAIMPGVLIIEGLAQTAGVLGRLRISPAASLCLLTSVNKARFRQQVIPGDVLFYHVRLQKQRAPFFWFTGEAKVNDACVASAEFSAQM
ncbi:MAG: 3-hydroxyacyl-ACP dehydratase FabZ [Pseudomonadota bacterium]|nr:3-hydroxyacyl-ACP dehydratase FabZ [Pseudomonadota bacterium]